MALKATICKAQIQLSDMDRHVYETLTLTIAQHPSETNERMMVRLIAYLLNTHEHLQFTKGLSADDEPEIWQKNLSDEIDVWIDLGLPEEKRLRKACSRAKKVIIYTYGGTAVKLWWQRTENKVSRFKHLTVINMPQEQVDELTKMAGRSMEFQCTIQDGETWLSNDDASVTVIPDIMMG
ncbi:MAG: hypothetical protein ACI9FJ_001116 [Alteromonadaceae bacterium]|jgi:uncharacterized protein YaeQ